MHRQPIVKVKRLFGGLFPVNLCIVCTLLISVGIYLRLKAIYTKSGIILRTFSHEF